MVSINVFIANGDRLQIIKHIFRPCVHVSVKIIVADDIDKLCRTFRGEKWMKRVILKRYMNWL